MLTDSSVRNLPYSVSEQGDNYVVQIDRRLLTRDALSRLLDAFLFQAIVQNSQATQTEIDALAEEIERNAWAKVQSQFAP